MFKQEENFSLITVLIIKIKERRWLQFLVDGEERGHHPLPESSPKTILVWHDKQELFTGIWKMHPPCHQVCMLAAC